MRGAAAAAADRGGQGAPVVSLQPAECCQKNYVCLWPPLKEGGQTQCCSGGSRSSRCASNLLEYSIESFQYSTVEGGAPHSAAAAGRRAQGALCGASLQPMECCQKQKKKRTSFQLALSNVWGKEGASKIVCRGVESVGPDKPPDIAVKRGREGDGTSHALVPARSVHACTALAWAHVCPPHDPTP